MHLTNILLVDDDEINGIVVSHLGKQIGANVSYASGGEIALKLFSEEKFDLVLMDIEMPGMDGLQTARALQDLPGGKAVPIIALTAHADEYTQKQAEIRQAGMVATLPKPPTAESLRAVVEAHV